MTTAIKKKKKAVPVLRFPEFYGNWERVLFGDIAETVGGLTYSPSDIREEGLLVLRSSNVQNSEIELKDNVYVDLQIDDEKKTKQGDILLCVRNGSRRLIGKSALIKREMPNTTHGAFMSVLRGSKNDLLFQYMQSERYYREVHKNLGATINSINGSDLKKFHFFISPLEAEQEKIADFLGLVDGKISQLTRKRDLLADYKKGCMEKIFSQELRFKDDNGNAFPDWEKIKLKSVGDIFGGGTPPTGIEAYWQGKINWFTPTEIKFKYLSESKRKITPLGLQKSSAKMLPKGTLLLSTRASVGDIGIATIETSTNQGFQSIVVNGKNNNEFWYYWICQNKKLLLRRASGSTFLEISKSEIQKISALKPSLAEQEKIATFLSAIDTKIDLLDCELHSVKIFKKGLLQQMFV